jgi:predicted nucleotidyltransferase
LGSPQSASVSELARAVAAPTATVHREISRLTNAGVLTTTRRGRSLLVSANDANPALAPLRELVLIAFGPRQVVSDEFAEVSGVKELAIFGSWAARYLGEAGSVPSDVDVLVVGEVSRDDVYDAADRAAKRLRREVNPTVVSLERWQISDEPFLRHVRSRALVPLLGRPTEPTHASKRREPA